MRVILFLGLTLLMNFGFASDNAVTNHTDLAINFLSQIFGDVGNVLVGESGQMLGTLMSAYNNGVLVVSGIWLTYTVGTVIMRLGLEGVAMQQQRNSLFTCVRVALGVMMLFPSPTTGYNLVQDVVMKVVVQSVVFADNIWDKGLDYIQDGGAVWERPSSSANSMRIDPLSLLAMRPQSTGVFKSLLLNQVCVEATNIINKNSDPSASTVHTVVGKDGSIYFPNNCGTGQLYVSTVQGTPHPLLMDSTKQLIEQVQPVAKRLACAVAPQGISNPYCTGLPKASTTLSPSHIQSAGESMYQSLSVFLDQANIVAHEQSAMASHSSDSKDAFVGSAKRDGFLAAGMYWWNLVQTTTRQAQTTNPSSYIFRVKGGGWTKADTEYGPSAYVQQVKSLYEASESDIKKTSSGQLIPPHKISYPMYTSFVKNGPKTTNRQGAGDGGATDIETRESTGGEVAASVLSGLLPFGQVITDIVQLSFVFDNVGSDPVYFCHALGTRLLTLAMDCFLTVIGLVPIALVAHLMDACQPAGAVMDLVVNWIKPMFITIAGLAWTAGVILNYFVPLVPYALYLFAVLGWLIAVVEAMIAAPLIAVSLTNPDGHEFLGEAKQGLMLLLGTFLRPALMVLGFISGMILSFVGLRILIYTFGGFIGDLYSTEAFADPGSYTISSSVGAFLHTNAYYAAGQGSFGIGGMLAMLVSAPAVYVAFAYFVFLLVSQAFSMITVVADVVLQWVGGPQKAAGGANPADMMRQLQGGVAQGGVMGQSAKEAAQGKQWQDRQQQAQKSAKDKEDEGKPQ